MSSNVENRTLFHIDYLEFLNVITGDSIDRMAL